MTWRTELSDYHPDTILIVEIAQRFLAEYFGHNEASAQDVLTRYFQDKKRWIDEGYVRHEHSWGIATEAQYRVVVGGPAGNIAEWRLREGLVATPRDALEYLEKHYWHRWR